MDSTRNKIGVISLIIIIILFVVGGFFLMQYMVDKSKTSTGSKKEEKKEDYRIDATKDYVYFGLEEEIIHDVLKQDVTINFKGFESINETLKNELVELSKEVKTTEGMELPEETVCENDLYSFKHRDYTYTKFGDYISLLIVDYNYNCETGSVPEKMKSYIIKKSTGKVMTTDELKQEFKVTDEAIINAVKKKLNDTQTLLENKDIIEVDATVNSFNSGSYNTNKAISVSKTGKLVINFIVKSSEINYNDSIEIN